jgi:hypothetical protein
MAFDLKGGRAWRAGLEAPKDASHLAGYQLDRWEDSIQIPLKWMTARRPWNDFEQDEKNHICLVNRSSVRRKSAGIFEPSSDVISCREQRCG